MSDEIVVIDRRTFKLMKYVYRHDHVSLSVLDKRFGKKIDSVSAIISYLCHSHYGAYRSPGKSWTFDTSYMEDRGYFGLTIEGNKYVEDRIFSFLNWYLSTVISILAVLISFIALIMSAS